MFRCKPLFMVSLALNLVFILFFVLAFFRRATAISFYEDLPGSPERLTAAVLATVPLASGSIVFNAVEITMHNGCRATLQFSAVTGGRQANLLITSVYDHEIISVTPTGYGILITALSPGETVMQTLGEDGFRDIAFIKVLE